MRLATSARIKARTETRHTPRQQGPNRLLPFPARPDAQNFPVRTRRRHCRLNLNTRAKVSGRTVSSALCAAAVPGRDHRPGRRCAQHVRQTPPDCRRVRAMLRRMDSAWIAVMGTILRGALAASTALISQTLQAKRERQAKLADARRLAYVEYVQAAHALLEAADFAIDEKHGRTEVPLATSRRGAAACRSGSAGSRSADSGGHRHLVESWPARLVGERKAGMVGSRTRCRRPPTVDQSC